MAVSGHVASSYWAAALIGVLLLATLIATTTKGFMRICLARHNETELQPTDELSDLLTSNMGASLWRCRALIAEAVVVRQRLSGQIDAETYQIRMSELARQAISESRPQRNA